MTLAVDIGNTNIVIALHKGGKWSETFRYETKTVRPQSYYEKALRDILKEWNIDAKKDIAHCVVTSVVPGMNHIITDTIHTVIGFRPLLISPKVLMNLDIHVPLPHEIGSDLVSNAYSALKTYHDHCIVVDFGTALSFTVVNKNEGITGVTFAPGIKTALFALTQQTSQLPLIPLELPESVIGHDTVSAMQAGILWGYVGLVKEILSRMKYELGNNYKVIATGGLSSILEPLKDQFDYHDKLLTIEGARLIYMHYISNLGTK